MKNNEVDQYLERLKAWHDEVQSLRNILLECGLVEEFKWKVPCYTYEGKNIVIIGNFKANCTLSFLKGVLLKDSNKLLVSPGENSHAARLIKFTNTAQINQLESTIKSYVLEAIQNEKAGLQIPSKNHTTLDFCDELVQVLDQNQVFKTAFEALTPGRQRGYHLFFNAAKQSKTRMSRIEKFIPQILNGKGMNDCTCGLTKRPPGCDGSHQLMM